MVIVEGQRENHCRIVSQSEEAKLCVTCESQAGMFYLPISPLSTRSVPFLPHVFTVVRETEG